MSATAAEPMNVLITGCSAGIGRALALEYHARGCRVVATARSLAALTDLSELGITVAQVDVTRPETIAAAVAAHGPFEIAVANAGSGLFGPLVEEPLESFRALMDVNVAGVLATVQAVAPAMVEAGHGEVLVIGSVSGALVTPYAGGYCASKAAVEAMCTGLRMELAPLGVQAWSVVHVATAAVLTNFAYAAAPRPLAPSSWYTKVGKFVEARARLSQSGAISAPQYARQLVGATLGQRRQPAELVLGGRALKYRIYGKWLPRAYTARVYSRMFGLDSLAPPSKPAGRSARAALAPAAAVGLAAFALWLARR